jgi:predicted lipoprotein with Yx(FWY)xxD motif
VLALAATAGLTAAACSSSSGSGGSGASSPAPASSAPSAGSGAPSPVGTHGSTTLGEVFADASGKTLYSADQEAGGTISCTGGCLQFWHPVSAAGSAPASGGFASVKRPDTGQKQLTYAGRPVYTFAEDAAPGDTKGDGFQDAFAGKHFTWHALTVHPGSSTSAPPSTSGSGGSGGSGGGYGY